MWRSDVRALRDLDQGQKFKGWRNIQIGLWKDSQVGVIVSFLRGGLR